MITDISTGKNNYKIELDIDTAIYSYEINVEGLSYKKIYPVGTLRKQVVQEVEKIITLVKDNLD
jgi:hypothetical protein